MMYNCDQCSYTSDRLYNYKRHLASKHAIDDNKSHLLSDECECSECGKILKKENMESHALVCTKTMYEHVCESCQGRFATKKSLYNHERICKKKASTPEANTFDIGGDGNTVYNSIGSVTDNRVTNNTTNNTTNVYNLLVYPDTEKDSADFDFVSDHIKDHVMKQVMNQKPVFGFNDFMKKIFANPVNRIVKKTNTNGKFCKVYAGNNEWHTKIDLDVMPTIMFHITTAALYRIAEFKKTPLHKGMADIVSRFLKYVEQINQSDLSEKDFEIAVDRLKSILVTLSELEKTTSPKV